MGDWSDTIPSFLAGQRGRGSRFQTLADVLTALTGPGTDYTPTWAAAAGSVSLGTGGAVTGTYTRVGKFVVLRLRLLAGTGVSTGTPGTYWTFTLPSGHVSAGYFVWAGRMLNAATLEYSITANIAQGASTIELFQNSGRVTTASPFTFSDADSLWTSGVYELA